MGFAEWSIDYRNKNFPAKAQRRKGKSLNVFFAPLRLCGKLLFVLSLLGLVASAQSRRALTPADILRVNNVGDAQISPNAEWVVYTVGAVEGDQSRSTLWLWRAIFNLRPPTKPPKTTHLQTLSNDNHRIAC